MIRFPWQQKKRKWGFHTSFTTSLVPVLTEYPDREKKAAEILKWLVEIKAVKPELSACTFYEMVPGYAINKGAKKLSEKPRELPFNFPRNGLEIILKRTVFESGDLGLHFVECPVCKKSPNIIHLVDNFTLTGNPEIVCEGCECTIEINEFLFSQQWAFSDLGFTFWEWKNLKKEFILEFEKRLGCKVKVVECLIEDKEIS